LELIGVPETTGAGAGAEGASLEWSNSVMTSSLAECEGACCEVGVLVVVGSSFTTWRLGVVEERPPAERFCEALAPEWRSGWEGPLAGAAVKSLSGAWA
jgi:hypothetical protein